MNLDREERIRALFPLVRRIAHRVHRTMPSTELDDLVGDGSVGLIKAVDAFDPSRGTALDHYARRVILGAMLNGIRRADPVSERVRRSLRKADAARFAIAQERGSLPPLSEFEAGDPSLARARAIAYAAAPLSLDAPLPQDEGALAQHGSDPAEQVLAGSMTRDVEEAIARLPERQRSVVTLHYYGELSLHAVGRRLRISPQRASQLHLAALKRLRARFLPA